MGEKDEPRRWAARDPHGHHASKDARNKAGDALDAHNAAADACGKPKDHTEPEDDVEKLILAAAVGMG